MVADSIVEDVFLQVSLLYVPKDFPIKFPESG